MNAIEVSRNGSKILGHYLPGRGPATVVTTPPGSPVAVSDVTQPESSRVSLCQSLLRGT
jgi:hypothetical protein